MSLRKRFRNKKTEKAGHAYGIHERHCKINDILDISRMESGRIKFVWEECDVVELCQTALSTVEYGRKTKIGRASCRERV